MAKAEKITQQVVTETVTLTLSKAEAETLRAVLDRVAGTRDNSPRKHTDAIASALGSAGVHHGGDYGAYPGLAYLSTGIVSTQPAKHPASLAGGSVQFKDYPSHWKTSDRG